MNDYPAGEALDAALDVAFGGPEGIERMKSVLGEYDAAVGSIFDDDEDRGLLRLVRADWALCECPIPGGAYGETWLHRVCRSGALEASVAEAALRTRHGIWALWPADSHPIARCQLSGVTVRVVDPDVSFASEAGGLLAVWDARFSLEDDGAYLCRAPLTFPRSALAVIPRPARPGASTIGVARLRASLLRHRRAYRRRGFELAPDRQ